MVLETVRQTIQKYGLLKDGDKVLIACSGGADSTALLAVFLELRRERPMELSIGHFNHRLRPEAAEDEAFVRRMARSFGLPLFAASEDVGQVARSRGLNLEEAARALRYGFLEETARKIGAAKIATGHTMNDQAETFFLRLLRGSGLTGLGCIHPVVEEKIIRPLLFVERGEIEAFLRERGMSFRQDKSNRDRRFTRNRIRLELIPYLQKHFDPHIIRRISRLVALLQEEEHLLQSIAKEEAPHHITGDPGNPALSLDSVHSLPPALARRIIRCFL
ncbi:MAG: tRNA lysidine(34) synthetase TilS, partial [Candidatus Aminicenantales bacterium]